MRKMLSCILVGIIVTACSSSSYERDPSPGKFKNITLDKMVSKINKKESFAVALTQSMCIYCEAFEEMFKEYAQDHHVIIYKINLSTEKGTPAQHNLKIHKYFPDFATTPGVYFVESGKLKNALRDIQNEITQSTFEQWVVNNKLDKAIE